MKKALSMVLVLTMVLSLLPTSLFGIPAGAEPMQSGQTGDCTWVLDGSVLTISGNGATSGDYAGGVPLPWGTEITKVVIEEGVTSLADISFFDCSLLEEVSLPSTLTQIGAAAFGGCTNLKSIVVPQGVEYIGMGAFSECSNLEKVTLLGDIGSIPMLMFADCSSLKTVVMPEVYSIGMGAFVRCSSLTDIWYGGPQGDIQIESSNDALQSATWHYDSCIKNPNLDGHSYEDYHCIYCQAEVPLIASIDINDVTIMEHTNGYYDEGNYYYDSFSLSATITFRDGSTQDIDDFLILEDEWYWIEDNSLELQWEDPWAVGTHTVTGSLLGVSDTFNITITENPIASIDINDVSIIEYTNGYYNGGDYFYPFIDLSATITYKDGSTQDIDDYLILEDEWYWIEDNSLELQWEEPWTVGTHTVTATLMGMSDTFNVTITETPIASIDIKDVTIIEHTNGYDVAYDTADSYYYSPKLSATVTFKDGSTQDINDYLVLEDDWYSLDTNMSSLQNEQPWSVGTYTVTGSLLGASDTFRVTIAKSPVASIEIKDLSVMEVSCGYTANNTFYYKPAVTATITFKDGTKKENADGFTYYGRWYALETDMADLQYDQPWSVGTYVVTASLLDAQDTFCVTVLSKNLPSLNFADVGNNDWFASYISYAVVNGLFKGTSETTFEPHENITRAQLVQALANLSKVDTSNPNVATPFTDVPAGMWYSPAIRWAVENGIVSGMGDGTFEPNTPITREQMCLMLVNYVEKYQKNELVALADVSSFEDDATISSWAKEAVYKCAKSKLINGMGDGTFNPQGTAIRAQGATLFSNFHKYLTTEIFPVSPAKIKDRSYKLIQPDTMSDGEFSWDALEITTLSISDITTSYGMSHGFCVESALCDPQDHAEYHDPFKYNGKEYCYWGGGGGDGQFRISDNRIILESGIELELLSNDTLRVVALSPDSYWGISLGDIFA